MGLRYVCKYGYYFYACVFSHLIKIFMVKSVFSCFRFMRSLPSNFALHVVRSWGDGRAARVCGAEGRSEHKKKWLKPLDPKVLG